MFLNFLFTSISIESLTEVWNRLAKVKNSMWRHLHFYQIGQGTNGNNRVPILVFVKCIMARLQSQRPKNWKTAVLMPANKVRPGRSSPGIRSFPTLEDRTHASLASLALKDVWRHRNRLWSHPNLTHCQSVRRGARREINKQSQGRAW